MLGYEMLAQSLAMGGVERIFGVLGEGNLRYIAEFSQRGEYVASTNEGGAVGMADGYSRFSERVGVAAVTHGPGLTNALTALTEAVRARSRLLLLASSSPPGRRHLQRFDLAAAVALTGATYRRVREPDGVANTVIDAIRACTSGPVVLDVPVEIQIADVGALDPAVFGGADPVDEVEEEHDLDMALGLLVSARHPIILAGRGAILARESLSELAGLAGAQLATTVLAKDLFRGVPGGLGIMGSVATEGTLSAIVSSDCILAFGTSLDGFTTMNGDLLRGRHVMRCDNRQESLDDWPVDVAVLGDADAVAREMVRALRAEGADERSLSRFDAPPLETAPDSGFELDSIVRVLDRALPEDRILVTDTGRFKGPVWQGFRVGGPEFFSHTIGFGALGLGLSCSIGAALANRAQLTVCVAGDGGFMMGATELATAARLGLPLLVVVLNDLAYGAEFKALKALGLGTDLARLSWPSPAGLAEALGCRARTAASLAELESAVRWVIDERESGSRGPYLLEVLLDPATIDL